MSESLEKLHNRILADARLKAEEIIGEAEAKARQIVEGARQQAQKEADGVLAQANLEAEAIRRGVLSSKVRANRLRILGEKNRIVEDVMRSVENRLSNLAGSSQFEGTLKRFVTEAVEAVGSDQPMIRVGFRGVGEGDLNDLGRGLPKGSKFVVEDRPIDDLGGVVASDSEGRVVFNNSFKSRLERLDNRLLTLISSVIFD